MRCALPASKHIAIRKSNSGSLLIAVFSFIILLLVVVVIICRELFEVRSCGEGNELPLQDAFHLGPLPELATCVCKAHRAAAAILLALVHALRLRALEDDTIQFPEFGNTTARPLLPGWRVR